LHNVKHKILFLLFIDNLIIQPIYLIISLNPSNPSEFAAMSCLSILHYLMYYFTLFI